MKQPISFLKNVFSNFKIPTGQNFSDLIDSVFHKDEKIPASSVEGWTDDSAVEILGNELPELDSKNKYLEVLGGAAGRTLTYKGTPFPITANTVTIMFWSGKTRTWKKQDENPLPAGADGRDIKDWTAKPYTFSSTVSWLVIHEGVLWENKEATLPNDVPGMSSKWIFKAGTDNSPLGIKKSFSLSESGAAKMYSSSFLDGRDVWTLGVTTKNIYVLKNGIEFIKIVNTTIGVSINVSFSSIGVANDKIHLLVSSYDLTATQNGLTHVIIDIATKVVSNKKATVEGNSILTSFNQILFNNTLYTSVNTVDLIVSNAIVRDNTNLRITVLKLVSDTWEITSTPAVYGEQWGDTFTNSSGVVQRGVNITFPVNSTLFSHKGDIYINYISTNGVFLALQKSSTDGIIFAKKRILPSDQQAGYAIFGVSYKDNIYYLVNTYYINKLTQHKIYSLFNYDFSKRINIEVLGTGDYSTVPVVSSDSLINTSTYFANAVKGQVVIEYLDFNNYIKYLNNLSNGSFLGDIVPDSIPYATPVIGDYYNTATAGEYANFKEKITFLTTTTPTVNNVTVYRESCKIIYKGYGFWSKESSTFLSNQRYNVLARGAANNPFQTSASRIPILIEDKNKRMLLLADIRYTSGDDYDSIDVGTIKSYDYGKTWKDARIAIRRDDNLGWRLHDASAVMDKETGRIWVIGKQWEDVTSPFVTGFWSQNRDKMRLYSSYSDDNGLTWSLKFDITALKMASAWHISSGCGAGIQLADGTLIMPIYEVEINGTQYSNFIYLEKGGTVWKKPNSKGAIGGNECQILEHQTGDLYLLQRVSGVKKMWIMRGGISGEWEEFQTNFIFKEPAGGVFSAFVKYNNTYIFAGAQTGGSISRNNITVFYSINLIDWHELTQVTNYSTMGYTSIIATETHFGCLFEDKNLSLSYQSLEGFRNILR